VQFQGMIAEHERAQIAERSRRGKRYMAQRGGVNVLSGAPYGYRYVKKSDTSAAFYEIIEAEAKVVRLVYEIYTQQGLSINAIARLLLEREIPTRTGKSRWERSKVMGHLAQSGLFAGQPAMARQNCAQGKESRGPCGSEKAYRAVTVPITSGPGPSGFPYRYQPW
jgi:hypothetical protein